MDGVDGNPKRLYFSIRFFSSHSAPNRRPSVRRRPLVVRPPVRPSSHPHVRGLRAKLSEGGIPYARD